MSPTVRIDEEVWAWLQGMARPFEDTPNSVLRRVAGLDKGKTERIHTENKGSRQIMRITGEKMNQQFKLGGKHALYHKDGTFYEQLRHFPGILFDHDGYVMYDSLAQFERDSNLNIGKKVNVQGGLARHPRYRPLPDV